MWGEIQGGPDETPDLGHREGARWPHRAPPHAQVCLDPRALCDSNYTLPRLRSHPKATSTGRNISLTSSSHGGCQLCCFSVEVLHIWSRSSHRRCWGMYKTGMVRVKAIYLVPSASNPFSWQHSCRVRSLHYLRLCCRLRRLGGHSSCWTRSLHQSRFP